MLHFILITVCVLLNAICMWSIHILIKDMDNLTWKSYMKYLLGIPVGAGLSLLLSPITVQNIIPFALMGGIVGELLSLLALTIKQAYKKDTVISYYDDGSPSKFFITGDKHRHFDRVKEFCREMNTRRKDVLIILGDSGFNYYDDKRDDELKKEISALNITLFCLHGNKENRPQNVGTYGIRSFCGGKVYYEPKYPNIYFAIDGEIYTFEGKKYMVVGGAHSVDKMRCLEEGTPFWFDEMPNDTIKAKVELELQNQDNKIFGMMTHTCPIDYLPTEMFISTIERISFNLTRIINLGMLFKSFLFNKSEQNIFESRFLRKREDQLVKILLRFGKKTPIQRRKDLIFIKRTCGSNCSFASISVLNVGTHICF